MMNSTNSTIGFVRKLKGVLPKGEKDENFVGKEMNAAKKAVQYFLPIGDQELPLNPLLGKIVTLSFDGHIQCIACGQRTKKSYNQGYCFPCTQKLAQCDLCIVRPERCHYHLGTCREPDWAETHCMIPHIVYIANTSGLKVGITRETQIPTRWIDQGAIQALPLARVATRQQAGLIESSLALHFADKTDWRKMLKGETDQIDLTEKRAEVMSHIKSYISNNDINNGIHVEVQYSTINSSIKTNIKRNEINEIEEISVNPLEIHYPVLEAPSKIQSLNLDKTPSISGVLLGIKAQYLIFDCGVINIRNIAGFELTVK